MQTTLKSRIIKETTVNTLLRHYKIHWIKASGSPKRHRSNLNETHVIPLKTLFMFRLQAVSKLKPICH